VSRAALTTAEIAELATVSVEVVLAWFRAGTLRAYNVARPGCRRPRWRVDPSEWERFKQARQAGPAERSPRRKRKEAEEVVFY
jgi:hypothetical protein